MARNKATSQKSSPEAADEQIAAPEQESPQADPSAMGVEQQGSSHADATGKKPYLPDPFTIAVDVLAGVKLKENRQSRQMEIQFTEKPSQIVLETMKNSGYRWNSKEFSWTHRLQQESAMTTRIDAERLFQEVAGMIRQERGIGHSHGVIP